MKIVFRSLFLVSTLIGVANFLFSLVIVSSDSMQPLYRRGDLVLVAKFGIEPEIGQVVVFRLPQSDKYFVRRLVAIGPAWLQYDEYQLLVNGEPYPESEKNPPLWDRDIYACRYTRTINIPAGQYFGVSDQRCFAGETAGFFPFQRKNLEGVVIGKIL
jgi:signal peptidase I